MAVVLEEHSQPRDRYQQTACSFELFYFALKMLIPLKIRSVIPTIKLALYVSLLLLLANIFHHELCLPSCLETDMKAIEIRRQTESQSQLAAVMQRLHVDDFHLLHSPPACRGQVVSILVLTRPNNFQLRQTIRRTWAKGYPVHFLLGSIQDRSIQSQIDVEANKHHDLLQGTFVDTYRNLTYKTLMGLAWAQDKCTTDYVVKTDDDTMVHVKNMQKYLLDLEYYWKVDQLDETTRSQRTPPSNRIHCHLMHHSRALRHPRSKWYVTHQEYSPKFYPTYCQGALGIIYSQKASRLLLDQIENVKFLWLEDVYVTGLLREKTKVEVFQVDKLNRGSNSTSRRILSSVLGPTGLTSEKMEMVWYRLLQLRNITIS